MNKASIPWLTPQWPVPKHVKAVITTRQGGVSRPPYDSFNLAQHVQDDIHDVKQNRALLTEGITQRYGRSPHFTWLQQVHSTDILTLDSSASMDGTCADAVYTQQAHIACAILTADCLPILFCNDKGTEVAAVHAGWRGLSAGIIQQTLQRFSVLPQKIHTYLGPAISQAAFQVGADVKEAFLEAEHLRAYSEKVMDFFIDDGPGKYKADLYALARAELYGAGIASVSGGDYCTYLQNEHFYSFRRTPQTGRMLTAIWLDS